MIVYCAVHGQEWEIFAFFNVNIFYQTETISWMNCIKNNMPLKLQLKQILVFKEYYLDVIYE